MKHLSTGLSLALLLLALAGCIHWNRSDPIPADKARLWQAVREAVSLDYAIDERKSSLESGYLVTEWRYDLAVHYRDGYRSKVEVELAEHEEDGKLPAKDRRWVVKLRVYKEINDNVENPLVKPAAKWDKNVWWESKELQILAQISMPFRSYGISDYARRPAPPARPSNSQATETRPLAREREVVWGALHKVCKDLYPIDQEHEKAGKLTSKWQLVGQPEVAEVRRRLTVRLLPDTTTKATGPVFRVEVRIDQQRLERKSPGSKDKQWAADGRDRIGEEMLAEAIEKAVVAR